MSEEIGKLLELQAKDRERYDLLSRLEQLEEEHLRLEQELAEEQSAVEERCQQVKQLAHDSHGKNLEVDDVDTQIRNYQKRLDEGIISFKEMEALQAKIAHQRKRIDEMEDNAIELMDKMEIAEAELVKVERNLDEQKRCFASRSARISSQVLEVKEKLESRKRERAAIKDRFRAHLLSHYEGLYSQFDDPVVAIVNGLCSGCKLKLNTTTIERARTETEIVTCQNCSRILYVS